MKRIKLLTTLMTILSFALLVSCEAALNTAQEELDRDIAGNDNRTALEIAMANAEESPPVVEIRHLVEPKIDASTGGGAYLKKLTIPKDYKGKLYLAGINLSTLHGKNIKVRFKLGVTNHAITIPADVATAPGLTAGSSVSVLVMDLRDRPFSDLRLKYDLYDYNDYTFDGSSSANALADAVSYNRDTKLYCRGLNLADDSTYTGSVADHCDQAGDICKFAYAKVVDQGLTFNTVAGRVSINPSRPNIQSTGSSYYTDSDAEKLMRCLPANPLIQTDFHVYNGDPSFNFSGVLTQQTISGTQYHYDGPFKLLNTGDWAISGGSAAMTNSFGLFRTSNSITYFYDSYMFPRYVKNNLGSGVEYLGSAVATDEKIVQTMNTSGESLWMDGCNERATTYNPTTAEHIGSCDVSGSIEVFQVNADLTESMIAVSKDVKLQIVRESNEPTDSSDVVSPSFQACSATSQCGNGECCINNRCWDKTIVSSCYEDEPSYGNAVTGASCTSDYNCASLCCQGGSCQPHDEGQVPPVLCSKQVGQSCIAKDWCAKQPVTRCFIVKTGVDAQGGQQCALRCYTNPESGECRNNTCAAPTQPQQPVFDETDPNRCATACDPPDFTNGVFSINCGGN